MNSRADIFRKCFNGNLKNMQKFNEFNKVSNIFINSYIQNIISTSKKIIKKNLAPANKKRYLLNESNSIIKKNFNQEFLTSTFSIPHPNKSKTGSEDSFLVYNR